MSIFEASKNIVQSKTFWANLLILLYDVVTKNADSLKQFGIDSDLLVTITTLLNIILRRFTTGAVTIMPKA
jgi:hypothetical protein